MTDGRVSQHQQIAELERQLVALHGTWQQNRRAIEALYNISLACQRNPSFQPIFEAIYQEMRAVFPFDACYIALCDPTLPNIYQAVLTVDEGVSEYEEHRPVGPLTGSLFRTRTPRLFRDLDRERSTLQEAPSPFGDQGKPSRSWLGVPLLVGQNAVGVISLQSYQPDLYDEADVDFLQRFANVVAVALENAMLDLQQRTLSDAMAHQVHAQTVALATLSAVAAELVLQKPLPTLLDRALEYILALFTLEGGIVRQLDPRKQVLTLLAQRGFHSLYSEEFRDLPVEGTVQGDVVRDNRPLTVADELQYEQLHSFAAMLSVPLRVGTTVLGTLALLSRAARTWSEAEIHLAQALGNQLAIAIENARLFHERERQISQLQALEQINRAANASFDLVALMRLIHTSLQAVLPTETFCMLVYDPEQRSASDGLEISGERERDCARAPIAPRLAQVLAEGRTITQSSAAESWLGVPLISSGGTAIGVISVAAARANAFDERAAAFLGGVAAQVVLHVQNTTLLRQRERQIRELNAIGQIGQLISASYDFDQMLHEVERTLCALADPSVFYIAICDAETQIVTNEIFLEEGRLVPIAWLGNKPAPGSITAWIMRERSTLLVGDMLQERTKLQERGILPHSVGPENPVRSWVGVPLLAKDGDPIGTLSLQHYQPFRYDQQTVDFLNQVANHISLGVQKVRLFHERERQLAENARLFAAEQAAHRTAETLREVARVLSSSFDSQEVLHLILRELHNVVAYDTASIMLVDQRMLRVAVFRGLNGGAHQTGDLLASAHRSGAAQVVRQREPLRIADTHTAPEWTWSAASAHVRSWLGVPLIARGTVLGVLNIDSREPHYFSVRDVEVAQAFASQASVALENARLYEESVTRVEQELDIARRIQSNLFPRELPQPAGYAFAASCLPARETGGDFYDVVELPGERLGLLAGDASGKSIQGAMLMAIARSIIRSEARNHAAPAQALRQTNAWIAHDVPRRTFVALNYATLDLANRLLTLTNAGQVTPLRRTAAGQIEYLDVEGPTLPLGIIATTPYIARDVPLAPGDVVVFLTDGIVEAKNQAGELYGFERFEAVLAAADGITPDTFISRALEDIAVFMDGAPQHDDMTLLVLKVAG